MKRVASYMRVSTDRQAKEGDSIPAQRDAIRTYIDARADLILADEYIDDGISGTKAGRDELQRLLSDVEQKKIDLICFTKLDRWFRSVRHYTATQEILDRYGVCWVAIWEPIYDTTTPAGRLIVNQMMSIAQFEAENTGQRIRQVFRYKAQNGEVLSGSTPPGYSISNKRLVPNDDAGSVVAAFREYSRTGSIKKTMRAVADLPGLPRTNSPFKHMLQNTVYIGEKYGNKQYCKPLVDEALFKDVQRQLSVNVKISQKETYIFSGLIRCAECGCVMGGNTRRRKRGGGPLKITHQYRCPRHYNQKPSVCENAKVISETVMERELLERLRPMIQNVVLQYEIEAAPARDRAAQERSIRRKIDRLKELYVNEMISIDEYKRDREKFLCELKELESVTEPVTDVEALKALLATDIESLYLDMTPAEKRRFWRAVIKEIRFGADRAYSVTFV